MAERSGPMKEEWDWGFGITDSKEYRAEVEMETKRVYGNAVRETQSKLGIELADTELIMLYQECQEIVRRMMAGNKRIDEINEKFEPLLDERIKNGFSVEQDMDLYRDWHREINQLVYDKEVTSRVRSGAIASWIEKYTGVPMFPGFDKKTPGLDDVANDPKLKKYILAKIEERRREGETSLQVGDE